MDGWMEISRSGPDTVTVAGLPIGIGSRVILHPRSTRDVFAAALAGRRAIVDAVEQDLEDQLLLAVILEDDPARDLGTGRQLGHRFFFAPDEVDPVRDGGGDDQARRVLVAGIGNTFTGDDRFGVAVAGRLAARSLPEGVDVLNFGIRGRDAAHALGDGYDVAVLVGTTARGEPPGTISVIEPKIETATDLPVNGQGMDPVRVLLLAQQLGRLPARTLVVGCEPHRVAAREVTDEVVTELSAPVADAVHRAVTVVESLLKELVQR